MDWELQARADLCFGNRLGERGRFAKKALGCHIWNTENEKYIDFSAGNGTSILGYAHEAINKAIIEKLTSGYHLSLPTIDEIECAEKIKDIFPFVDHVRFFDSQYTAQEFVLALFPKHTEIIPSFDDISKTGIEVLHGLRTGGIPLIFNEIKTGFRVPKFCIANHIGIEPDIIILGGAIANGLPLTIVAGKKQFVNSNGNYFGQNISLTAAKTTMELLRTKYSLKELWEKGEDWLKEFNSFWPDKLTLKGFPTIAKFSGQPEILNKFFEKCYEAGILFGKEWYFNFPLSEKIEVLSVIKEIICRMKVAPELH